jgi:hypothetical protein
MPSSSSEGKANNFKIPWGQERRDAVFDALWHFTRLKISLESTIAYIDCQIH